jgi:hypothetical protein
MLLSRRLEFQQPKMGSSVSREARWRWLMNIDFSVLDNRAVPC